MTLHPPEGRCDSEQSLSKGDATFRDEVRTFMAENHPAEMWVPNPETDLTNEQSLHGWSLAAPVPPASPDEAAGVRVFEITNRTRRRGVMATYVHYPDLSHAFIQMTAHSKSCLEPAQEVARLLGKGLAKA
jgi:hypothetical protein